MIPNQFHFVFGLRRQTEPFHLVHYLCLESCIRVNQPERVFFYYHYRPYGRYWDLIKDKLDLVQAPLVPFVSNFKYKERSINQFRYAHHSDFIRLEKLLESGGVYADMDTLFVNKLPLQLYEKPFVLGREPGVLDPRTKQPTPSLCNAFIMSEANAAFGQKWLDGMCEAFDGTWSNHSTLLPQRLSERFPETVHIEPIESFYKFPSSPEGIADIFENLMTNWQDIYSIHLWAHLWWDILRIDFSTFYGARITEEYVSHANTTYAVIARRFLPETRPAAVQGAARKKTGDAGTIQVNPVEFALLLIKTVIKIVVFNLLGDWHHPDSKKQVELAKKQFRFLRRLLFRDM
ncbi:MAG: hypothetical protein JXA42_17510 [Anaerolineales bacterium]|nr:hypothetical protein [Anaerolineales bacterium]